MLGLRLQIFLILTVFALAIVSARAVVPAASTTNTALGAGTTIVLLHGLGGSSRDWHQTAERLAAHHRVVMLDLPGHGQSRMPEPFSLEAAAASLDRALAGIPGGPVILVGHSLGGLVAAAEASEHPERIRGLILVEAALRPQIPEEQRAGLLDRLEGDYPAVLHDAYLSFGRDSAQGGMLARRAATFDPQMMRRWIRLAWAAEVTEQVTRLGVPVLAVLSERSWAAAEPWEVVADSLGYAGVSRLRATRVPDCGHFIMLDQPARLAAIVAGFAARPEGLNVVMLPARGTAPAWAAWSAPAPPPGFAAWAPSPRSRPS